MDKQIVLPGDSKPQVPAEELGLWLPINSSSTQFYFHKVSEGSTCECSLCGYRKWSSTFTDLT